MVYERTKKAVIEFRDKIEFNVYHTIDHEILKYWGISDALFINGKQNPDRSAAFVQKDSQAD